MHGDVKMTYTPLVHSGMVAESVLPLGSGCTLRRPGFSCFWTMYGFTVEGLMFYTFKALTPSNSFKSDLPQKEFKDGGKLFFLFSCVPLQHSFLSVRIADHCRDITSDLFGEIWEFS